LRPAHLSASIDAVETPGSELPRGTVTFLFTDIEGSTELARSLGADFARVRGEHRRVLREAFAAHGGHEIDTAGDGFFVAFERAGDAVGAAVAAQRALSESQLAQDLAVRVRMGLHSAEPYVDDDGYVGVGVHRAARICAAGHGGQILLSNATAGIVEDIGVSGAQMDDLGEYRLKDMDRPQRLFQLTVDGLPSEFPPLRSLDADDAWPAIVTLLVSDVMGWFGVMQTLGDEQASAVARKYHTIVLDAVKADGGREFEVVADKIIAGFQRARDAIRAATKARSALQREPWCPGDPAVHMAIHSGQIVDLSARHLGLTGFRAVALCKMAEPWQILVSHATEALLEGELSDVRLRHLGDRTFEQLEHPVPVFEIDE
jgi:class 3 adenylate cyclase